MVQLRRLYPVLMITSLAGLLSAGAEAYNITVCSGESVRIFDSIQINNSDTSVTLYKNGDKHRPIAWWTSSNHGIEQENVVMDKYYNVWIINVHTVDEGNYIIQYNIHNRFRNENKVELSVWVAPPTTCKLDVTKQGNVLAVSLLGEDCGKPRASAYWKNYSGVTIHDEKVLQLQAGKEAGTYYACMKGPALSCAKSLDPSSELCYRYNIKDGQSQSDTSGSKTQSSANDSKTQPRSDGSKDDLHTWLIVIILLQCAVVVPMISFGIYRVHKKYRRMCLRNRRNADDQGVEEQPLHRQGQSVV
ncbi:hypothetical protein CHS0354_040410 [Potamilus streckersoni]|uniref:Uncharacterized protein n=1 Tax=Potamilus streckersoni TaxID=2493646 RepID=A0AAE0SZX0_9BIVA|nr:hypothetical protein CHS0354_040410 [Potamilus streckersoni]